MKFLLIVLLLSCSKKNGQEIILKQVSSDVIAEFEKKFDSKLQERNNNLPITLSPNLYPMVQKKNLGEPYLYERKLSDFRVPARCEYYFDKNGESLWYSTISWRATNGISVFDWSAQQQKLSDEILHKDEYSLYFEKLNTLITEEYSLPKTRTDELVNVGENSIGEKVTWETNDIKIVNQIQMPKGDEKEFLRITITTYWK